MMATETDDRAATDKAETDARPEPKPRSLSDLLQRWLTRYHPEKRYMRGGDG